MIAITGANGHLGTLVIKHLINRGIEPKEIIGIVRNKKKATDLGELGIELREADYNSIEQLNLALNNVNQLFLISSSEIGQRINQHKNVINAAKFNNIKLIAYTSVLKANSSKMILANEHLATEQNIIESGIPYIILRNGWYIENFTEQTENYLQHESILGSAGNGLISAATRSDYALAAVNAIVDSKQTNVIYELGGEAFTLSSLAETLSKKHNKNVLYKNIPDAELEKFYISIGLPQGFAHVLADSDLGMERGDLFTTSKDLENLINKKPTKLQQVV